MEDEELNHVCSIEKGYCYTLSQYFVDTDKHNGLMILALLNRETGKLAPSSPCWRQGGYKKGIELFIRFCPFCGTNYEGWMKILRRKYEDGDM